MKALFHPHIHIYQDSLNAFHGAIRTLSFLHGAACSPHISTKATEYSRAKTRSYERPSPHLHTRTWVCNASLLFFPPSLPSLTLFPQSTCKRRHATPLPPHP